MIDELRGLIARHVGRDPSPIAGLSLSTVSERTEPQSSIARPIFALVAQGARRIVFDQRVYEYGAGDYLVVSIDLPITGHYIEASRERPCMGVGVDLRPEVIASLLVERPRINRDRTAIT